MKKNILQSINLSKPLILLMMVLCPVKLSAENAIGFNIKAAKKTLSYADAQVKSKRTNLSRLTRTEERLEILIEKAQICVKNAQQNLKDINEIFDEGYIQKDTKNDDYLFLMRKKARFKRHASQCRLFIFRAQETLASLQEEIKKLSAVNLLKPQTPTYELLLKKENYNFTFINLDQLIKESGVRKLSLMQWVLLFILLSITLIIAHHFRNRFFIRVLKIFKLSPLLLKNIKHYRKSIKLFTILIVATIFLGITFLDQTPKPSLFIASSICLLAIFLYLAKSLAAYVAKKRLSKARALQIKVFGCRLFSLLVFLSVAHFLEVLLRNQNTPYSLIQLASSIKFTIYIILVGRLASPIYMPENNSMWRFYAFWKSIVFTFCAIIITLDWSGYHRLAHFISSGVIQSVLFLIIITFLTLLIDRFLKAIDNKRSVISKTIRFYLGIRSHRDIDELIMIRVSLYIIALYFLVLSFIKIWNLELLFGDYLIDSLIEGFKIGGLSIVPSRIVFAILLFSILHMVVRLIASGISRRYQSQAHKDTQVALASIVSYVGFAFLIFLALLVAGADFTGIAIIVGALSVGIGLGLQDIVNNFISGLVLLIEKPVKPGDRVRVGNTEGFVKKVRIRSTQITTMAKEDVIVPNSELISAQVINYMFRDQQWRISVGVGVAYGSDIQAVKEALLEVAQNHEGVVNDSLNTPAVYFREFGNSSLNFELWCVIDDVNRKYQVVHELNCGIDEKFKKRNITIAFPQLDVHFKDDLKLASKTNIEK